ncbi:MAG: deoxyribonuclease I [Methylococcales bacterium]|nr:deoxyribonuclease I [Methylococcales bacterium]MBT7443328.1 deoxyribonuclease I [Methylococcales bacterium]
MKITHSLLVVLTTLTLLHTPAVFAEHPKSFSSAKSTANKLYQTHLKTFYCNCDLKPNARKRNKLEPRFKFCGYEARVPITKKGKNNARAKRIEWEHVMPAWVFGHQRGCWQSGGRKNCSKSDRVFKLMESDLHNLVPAVGELNGDRSNFRFAMVPGEPRKYGACDFEVDFKGRKAEPPEGIRGDISRIYFYMAKKYKLKLSKSQKQLFNAWDKLDPVSPWECRRDGLITGSQGNSNSYVSEKCE